MAGQDNDDSVKVCEAFVDQFHNSVPATCRFTTEGSASLHKAGPHLVSCFTIEAEGAKVDAIVVNPFDAAKPKAEGQPVPGAKLDVGELFFQKPGTPWYAATMVEIHINAAQVTITFFAHAAEIVGVYLGPIQGLVEGAVVEANLNFERFNRVTCLIRRHSPPPMVYGPGHGLKTT